MYLMCSLEENAVLYQNYKEKALDIDSDEESEPKEQKPEEKIVVHHKPLRSTWSQLSAVSVCLLLFSLWEGKDQFVEIAHQRGLYIFFSTNDPVILGGEKRLFRL